MTEGKDLSQEAKAALGQPNKHLAERGIAQGSHAARPMTDMAQKGLLDFLRAQVLDAEWEIAKQRSRIEAYEAAIAAIENR